MNAMSSLLLGQFLLVVLIVSVAVLSVALGVIAAKRFRRTVPDDETASEAEIVEREVAVDPRPLPDSPAALTPESDYRGEVWLSLGALPVDARQFALVMAKLPIGTKFAGIEPDPINGEHAMKAGFTHWAFAAANPEKYPNGPRLWVSWATDNEPVISWPLVDD